VRARRARALIARVVWIGAVAAAVGVVRAAEPSALRVAVMPFDTVADEGGLAALGQGLQAMLTTDLASAPAIQLVERDKLAAIKGELALSKTGAIDKATAIKVGKLLGASHLLTGQVAIVGKAMRLDARLVDATTGEVVLADKIEGERELFFELEKALARKLVDALGAPLTPKERARLSRIHTADFEAFRRFSDGIEAFDQKAFDDARKALRDALERDQEFTLARLTLDDYEAIIARLEVRSDLLEQAERDEAARQRTARGAEQQLLRERLMSLRDSKDPLERLPALLALSRWYDRREAYAGVEMHETGDAFLYARTTSALVRAYVAEAAALFPKVPLFGTRDFIGRPPFAVDKLEEEQRHWLARFFGTRTHQTVQQYRNELLDDIEGAINSRDHARHLLLDVRGEAHLGERAFKLGLGIDPDAIDAFFRRERRWRMRVAFTLGDRFRAAGLFDESTRWFAEAGRAAQSPSDTRRATEEVEDNRDLVKFLAAHPSAAVREWMMMRRYELPTQRWEEESLAALEVKPLGVRGRAILANGRQLRTNRDEPYVLLGERAIFPIGNTFFSTGRRTDPLVASDLDYYQRPSRTAAQEWWLAIFEGQHAPNKADDGALTLRVALGYAPSADWWHPSFSSQVASLAETEYVDARPEVVVLFGLEDIEVPLRDDPEERNRQRLQRGLRGHGLRILSDRIELVKVSEPEVRNGFTVARYQLALETLASDSGAVRDGAKVSLSVRGREVSAKVGGLSVEAKLPKAPTGFTGFAVKGGGHVALIAPSLTPGR